MTNAEPLDRLALLRDHHASLADRIRQLRTGGRALDHKIDYQENLLGDA